MAKETFDRSKPHLNIGTIGTLITVKQHLQLQSQKCLLTLDIQKQKALTKLITHQKKKNVVLQLIPHTLNIKRQIVTMRTLIVLVTLTM